MITNWETNEDKLKRYSKVSAKKKLQMLEEMRLFFLKYKTKEARAVSSKLKEARK